MSTYRGAEYLQEQLDSLLRQTRLPDEMVVCDDGSADGTLDLLERFRAGSTFPVEIHRNPSRLGPAKSFQRAISLCQGAVVLLCDQDDVWSQAKVERILDVFERSPDIGGVFSDAALLNATSRPLSRNLWSAIGVTPRWRRRLTRGDRATRVRLLAQRNAASGATMAFRSTFRPLLLPIPDGWGHDEWIAILLAAATGLEMIPEPLIAYRIHPEQQVGLGRRPTLGARLDPRSPAERTGERAGLLARADLVDQARKRLVEASAPSGSEVLAVLASHALHLRTRGTLGSGRRRWTAVLGELASGRYHRHSRGWASAVRDMIDR
jgi:glycosyltransferase involved in cell wall biosynthesis